MNMEIKTEIECDVSQLLNELVNIVSSNLRFDDEDTETSMHEFSERELDEAKQIDEHLFCLYDHNDDCDDEFHMHNLKCDACESKKSLFWRRVTRNQIVCNICFFSKIYLIAFDDEHLVSERKSTNIDDLMAILGEELGLDNESSCNKKTRSKNGGTGGGVNSRMKKSQIKNKFQNLTDHNQQQLIQSRPLTRTTAKATSLTPFQTQVSTASSLLTTTTTAETQNGEEEGSCASSMSENNLNVNAVESNATSKANATTNVRKSARVSKSKFAEININNHSNEMNNANNQKAKNETASVSVNRRTKKFKQETRPPTRHETIISSLNMSNCVYHRGFYLKIGDIVALFDLEDKESVYFAQIRAFLIDQYGERSAVITWLIPINDRFKVRFAKDFNSDNFVLGPTEDYPRPLECLEFVCRLEQCTNKAIKSEYINKTIQYETNVLQHKFSLEDLALAKFRLITKKTFSNNIETTTSTSNRIVDESQEPLHVDYEIVKN
jgi:hypothetical protein